MKFGLAIPTCREASPYPLGFTNPTVLRDLAVVAERLGYWSLWANDHLANTPAQLTSHDRTPNYYEPLVTYAHLAAVTNRIKLMTATFVTPMREPVLFAKQVAVVDQLSGGRLIVGMGLGSQREEFEALARNPKWSRGAMQDEFVGVLRMLLDEGKGSFEGKYYKFTDIVMAPPPVQRPFPIYLSGNVPDAIERVATLANGWIVSQTSPEELGERVKVLRGAAAQAGRDPAAFEIALFINNISIDRTEEAAIAAFEDLRRISRPRAPRPAPPGAAPRPVGQRTSSSLVGTPEQIAERIREFKAVGVDHMGLVFVGRTPNEIVTRAALFATEVMPLVA
jgi:probable F420-dependent oxidoreductase